MSVAVIDLGYGDAGKGAITDRLASTGQYEAVVRFSGGCQAAHNVVLDDGRHHTFAQFGSGTLQGLDTYLSRYMMVEPFSLVAEADHLLALGVNDPLSKVHIDAQALLTTPLHWHLNRYREDARGTNRHGSCGRGIGVTAEYALAVPDAPRAADLKDPALLRHKLLALQAWCDESSNWQMQPVDLDRVLSDYALVATRLDVADHILNRVGGPLIFEGSQGVLLDEDYGFHPHTTWSHTTARNARTLAAEMGTNLSVLGVMRSYFTRHGAGPFVTEDPSLSLPESHNQAAHYQGGWRVGHLDTVALRYATSVSAPDALYITHLDAVANETKAQMARAYEVSGAFWDEIPVLDPIDFRSRQQLTVSLGSAAPVLEDLLIDDLPQMLGLPLVGTSDGPATSQGKIPVI